jgi:hypothetical protein
MRIVKPPSSLADLEHPVVFLAGSIELGKASPWQDVVEAAVFDVEGTLLNPRRDRWEPAWIRSAEGPQFREQVEWELRGLELADVILTYFDPATRSPITLLELGLYARSGKLLVCCPAGFWRKGDVDIVCRRYEIEQVDSLSEQVARLRQKIAAMRAPLP